MDARHRNRMERLGGNRGSHNGDRIRSPRHGARVRRRWARSSHTDHSVTATIAGLPGWSDVGRYMAAAMDARRTVRVPMW